MACRKMFLRFGLNVILQQLSLPNNVMIDLLQLLYYFLTFKS